MRRRTRAICRTVRRLSFPLAGAALLISWTGDSRSTAAPFLAEGEMPSVLAAPTDAQSLVDPGPDDGSRVTGPGTVGTPVGRATDGIHVLGEEAPIFSVDAAEHATCCPGSSCQCGAGCDPPGLLQYFGMCHGKSAACWVARTDGLLLWRDAPQARPIVDTDQSPSAPVLGADQLQSTATGGVRGSLLRVDGCGGNAWELTYIYAGNFTAQRSLPSQVGLPYAVAPPGIYGNNASQPFDSGTVVLLGRLQSAEFNRHLAWGPNFRWLAGFRWVQWHEQFTLEDTLVTVEPPITDRYQTTCDNNLYGGQIGADARLLSLGSFRLDSVVKAGAYYNEAVQASSYTTNHSANAGTASVAVAQSPAACSFVGEVGLTGVLPLTCNLDFRFGYFGLWLTGLAQPTQQLSGQQVTPNSPTSGTLTATGGTLLQGVSLGLEGRW